MEASLPAAMGYGRRTQESFTIEASFTPQSFYNRNTISISSNPNHCTRITMIHIKYHIRTIHPTQFNSSIKPHTPTSASSFDPKKKSQSGALLLTPSPPSLLLTSSLPCPIFLIPTAANQPTAGSPKQKQKNKPTTHANASTHARTQHTKMLAASQPQQKVKSTILNQGECVPLSHACYVNAPALPVCLSA